MSLKRRLMFLIVLLSLFFLFIYLYNLAHINNNYLKVYMAQEDFTRGSTLNTEKFTTIYLKKDNNVVSQNFVLNEDLDRYVVRKEVLKGKLLVKEDLILKDMYNKINEDCEIISIKIANPEDIVSYQIEKDSMVNLYYTGKAELASNIIGDMKNSYLSTNNVSSDFNNGYITVKLADNVKVINIFDKYGNVIKDRNSVKNELNKVDTIMFELKKDLVMKINNLKNYGHFSVSIIK